MCIFSPFSEAEEEDIFGALNEKCPSRARGCEHWFPGGGVVWIGQRSSEMWRLVEGSASVGLGP